MKICKNIKHTTPAINSLKNFLASDCGIPMSGSNFYKKVSVN